MNFTFNDTPPRHAQNCLIMGAGRSGTSMLGGILHEAGYYMGENLYPGRDANPKGFYENSYINRINENILAAYSPLIPRLTHKLTKQYSVRCPAKKQRWLMSISPSKSIRKCSTEISKNIESSFALATPTAYKDPRFSYTLPVWENLIPKTVKFVCIFRSPMTTCASTLKECKDAHYLASLNIDESSALQVWFNMHSHILKNYQMFKSRFLFIHCDQLTHHDGIEKLSSFLNIDLDGQSIDSTLLTRNQDPVGPDKISELYSELCTLANYSPELQT